MVGADPKFPTVERGGWAISPGAAYRTL